MNDERRAKINVAVVDIQRITIDLSLAYEINKASKENAEKIQAIIGRLLRVSDELQEVFEKEVGVYYNLTAGLRKTYRGEQMSDTIDELDKAIDQLECVIAKIKRRVFVSDLYFSIRKYSDAIKDLSEIADKLSEIEALYVKV